MFPFKFGPLTDIWLYIVCNLAGSGHEQNTDNASSRERENSAQYPLAYPREHQG